MDGCLTISGLFDPVRGAVVKAALEPLARKLAKDDDRTREQRNADALVELCNAAMSGGTRQRPQLNVTATMGTMYRIPDSPAAATDYGALVPGVTVKRIACDCAVTRYILEGDSVLIDMGRQARVIKPAQRRALMLRDKQCRWPGCSRPASYCEGHHVAHWIDGGPTNLENLVLLCWHHHWLVHEGRWHLFLDTDNQVHVLKPPLDLAAPPRGPARPQAA